MKKIAFIIVRYGENINGGAEVHCQMLAERLLPYYEVEVLTTTIRAFNHPDQDYTEGVSSWNGVTIRRFKPQPIDQEQFRPFRKKYKTARRIRQYLKKLNLLRAASFLHPEWKSGIENERPFYESTATHAPGLLRYIESHKAEYAAFIFANFYTPQAVLGSVVAPEKSRSITASTPRCSPGYGISHSTPKPNGNCAAAFSDGSWPRTASSAAVSKWPRRQSGAA